MFLLKKKKYRKFKFVTDIYILFSLFFRLSLLRTLYISLLVSVKILTINSTAYAISVDEIVDSVQAQYDSASTLKGYFKQTSYLKTFKKKQVSTGTVYFKKPGKMRWEYKTPEEQLIVSDNITLWFYIPEDKQVMKKNMNDTFDKSAMPYLFLLGQAKLREIFDIQEEKKQPEVKERYYIALKPKIPQANVEKIIIGINKKNYIIEETKVIDYFGNITNVVISGIKTGIDLADSIFHFTPPKGVSVIEQERN